MTNDPDGAAEEIAAQWPDFLSESSEGIPAVKRYRAFQAGGGGYVERPALLRQSTEARMADGGMELIFHKDRASFEVDVTALGWPEDWSGVAAIRLVVKNGDTPVLLRWSLVGARGRLVRCLELAARETCTDRLSTVELPLAQGIQPDYQPSALLLEAHWGEGFATEGEQVAADPDLRAEKEARAEPVSLFLRELALVKGDARASLPLVDRFGQRMHANWPEKVQAEAELPERLRREREQMAAADDAGMSPYGGRLNGPAGPGWKAGGFFRVEQDADGRWWLADPEGYPFWSVGVTGVRLLDTAVVEGREALFEALPDPEGPHGAVCNPLVNSPANDSAGKQTVGFYYWNVLRKYGTPQAWRDHLLRRLRSWKINTMGNWSELQWFRESAFPFTVALTTRLPGCERVGRFADIYASGWREAFRRHLREAALPLRGNPWVLGYFVDNEMPWRGLHRVLAQAPASSAAKQEWARVVIELAGGLVELGGILGAKLRTFADVAEWQLPDDFGEEAARPAFHRILHGAAARFADDYFRNVREELREVDPHHLYLGCRFVRQRPAAAICEAAGRYCDVVTVNSYDLYPRREQFREWHELTGRPILIGEHHFPLWGERQLPPLYAAFTAAERGHLYRQLLRKWAEQPWSLGCHWYQYCDQPLTGRPSNGENQPVGLVDICDHPYPELIEALAEAVPQVQEWHARGWASETACGR